MRPVRLTASVSSSEEISPLQPNQSAFPERTMLASATATPPACGACRRSITRLETKTIRPMLRASKLEIADTLFRSQIALRRRALTAEGREKFRPAGPGGPPSPDSDAGFSG